MARSPAEIQADIAFTRRVIEDQLEGFSRRVPRAPWTPWLVGAGALVLGLALSRLPLLRTVGLGARTVKAVITVAGAVAAVDRFLAERQRPAA
jgi:hypothetical protein